MAKWVERTLDNISVTPLGLNVIEGVYGRDGDGFLYGPNPEGNDNNPQGQARDYMTNIIIFGKDPFRVDIIGHWLGGHEPGNVGLFHLALERGMSTVLNPRDIPVYEWRDGKATRLSLDMFERTPLKTYYIVRDYNGQNEPYYHLCNEPFDYSSVKIRKSEAPVQPGIRILSRKYACDSEQGIEFDYGIPQDGYARIEIVNPLSGESEVLSESFHRGGHHMAVWNCRGINPGMYYVRLRCNDFDSVKTLLVS